MSYYTTTKLEIRQLSGIQHLQIKTFEVQLHSWLLIINLNIANTLTEDPSGLC